MNQRLVLHIGIHKTGTTTIQRFCASHREALRSLDVDYPLDATSDGRIEFNALGTVFPADLEEARQLWERVLAKVRAENAGTVFISAETLRKLTDDEVAHVREWTRSFDVRVLVYLRNVASYLLSAYKQRIKTGTFAGTFGAFIVEHAEAVDYDALVARWERWFGEDAVDVRVYDRVAAANGVVADVLEVLGAAEIASEPARANVSPDERTIALVRVINRIKIAVFGKRRRSRVFRLLRESALRRGPGWRVLESMFSAKLTTGDDRAAVGELLLTLPTKRLERRLAAADLELLFSPEALPGR